MFFQNVFRARYLITSIISSNNFVPQPWSLASDCKSTISLESERTQKVLIVPGIMGNIPPDLKNGTNRRGQYIQMTFVHNQQRLQFGNILNFQNCVFIENRVGTGWQKYAFNDPHSSLLQYQNRINVIFIIGAPNKTAIIDIG